MQVGKVSIARCSATSDCESHAVVSATSHFDNFALGSIWLEKESVLVVILDWWNKITSQHSRWESLLHKDIQEKKYVAWKLLWRGQFIQNVTEVNVTEKNAACYLHLWWWCSGRNATKITSQTDRQDMECIIFIFNLFSLKGLVTNVKSLPARMLRIGNTLVETFIFFLILILLIIYLFIICLVWMNVLCAHKWTTAVQSQYCRTLNFPKTTFDPAKKKTHIFKYSTLLHHSFFMDVILSMGLRY